MFTNPFFILCAFIKGIEIAIKKEREYSQVLKELSFVRNERKEE